MNAKLDSRQQVLQVMPNPFHPRRWLLELGCGHYRWVTRTRRPRKSRGNAKTMSCGKCEDITKAVAAEVLGARRAVAKFAVRYWELEQAGAAVVHGGYRKPTHGWTCFHCGETFTTEASAREHFGSSPVVTTKFLMWLRAFAEGRPALGSGLAVTETRNEGSE